MTFPNNLDVGFGDGGIRTAPPRTKSSSTPRKRLSGGTMNMRFMMNKRKKVPSGSPGNDRSDPSEPDGRGRIPSDAGRETSVGGNGNSNNSNSSNNNNDAVDSTNNSDPRPATGGSSRYEEATAVDMYGIEASLIGRRSFRGFNAPLERMWKDSKAELEILESGNGPRKKLSDEELLLRYKESSNSSSSSGPRGIGNLDKKSKKRKNRSKLG